VRTIYRDVDHLSASGVPITVERGAAGGFELLDGWRTRLTGFTPNEAKAVFMAGVPGPAAQLGLGEAAASAQLKLLAALPPEWQADAQSVGARFHLDPAGWYQSPARVDHLAEVAQAVWGERRLDIRYESWKGIVDRRIEPLGLVMKAGEWYVVANAERDSRTYKLSNIRELALRTDTFKRPRHFDLARHWAASIARFEAGLYRGTAVVRVSAAGRKRLRELSAAIAEAVDRSTGKPDKSGWVRVTIPIESVDHAAVELMRIGRECEALEPKELRMRIAERARAIADLYAR
jgi:predicted DNA-binding transcriptional regulator YafY